MSEAMTGNILTPDGWIRGAIRFGERVEQIDGAPADPATQRWEALPNDVILSRFRDPRDFASVKRWDYSAINQYPQGPETSLTAKSSYLTSLFWDRNLYANLQSSFFKDRFQTIIGLFDSRNDRGGNVYDTAGNFLWNGAAPAGSGSTLNGVRRPKPVRNTAPSVTAIWLPVDWVRLYANTMSAVDPGPAYSAYDGNGIDKEIAKKITKLIKEKGLKVQAQIQDDQVRVTGKSIDDLQTVIAILKAEDMEIPLQYVNMKS